MESERRLPGAAQYPRPEGISGRCYSPRNLQYVKRWADTIAEELGHR